VKVVTNTAVAPAGGDAAPVELSRAVSRSSDPLRARIGGLSEAQWLCHGCVSVQAAKIQLWWRELTAVRRVALTLAGMGDRLDRCVPVGPIHVPHGWDN
jgi:hypothetical protein